MIKFKLIQGIDGYNQGAEFRKCILTDEMEFSDNKDENDEKALHIIGRENDKVICYARMYNIADYIKKTDKVCVRKEDRLQYVADTMLRAFDDRAVSDMSGIIVADSPESALEFFLHEGFVKTGEEYIDSGIKYYKLKKDLTKVRGCRGGCSK